MRIVDRHAMLAAIAAALLLAACGKSEPPPPAPAPAPPPPVQAAAPAPSPDEALKRLAAEVYVFAYPLVLLDVMREVDTAKSPGDAFVPRRASPDATTKDVALPNGDVLYTRAWLDVSEEPVVLSFPDTKDRYYVMPMQDAWTNVFSSPGKRETGTEKRDFVVVGPNYKKPLPETLTPIKAPTGLVWVVGRIDPGTKADRAATVKLQDQFKATPLSRFGKGAGKAPPAHASANADLKTPPAEQVARMDARTFFTRFAKLLPANPPAKDDAPMVAKIGRLGLVGGQPFDPGKLEPAAAAAVEDGVKSAREAIATAARGSLGDLRNGWTIVAETGRYGTNYGLRAVMALVNPGANAPEDALFAATRFDAGGKPLNGANRYVIHFDKGKTPPVDGFWSLSMYDADKHFVANPLNRYALGTNDAPRANADGSLDLYLQNENPGGDKEANWLPTPKGDFNVVLRLYWPKQEVLERRWTPPAIRPAA